MNLQLKNYTKDYVRKAGEEYSYKDYSFDCHSNCFSLC